MIIITKEPKTFREYIDVTLPPDNGLLTRAMNKIRGRQDPDDSPTSSRVPGRLETTTGTLISDHGPLTLGIKYPILEDTGNDTRYVGVIITSLDHNTGEYEFVVDAIDSIENPRLVLFDDGHSSIPMQIRKST